MGNFVSPCPAGPETDNRLTRSPIDRPRFLRDGREYSSTGRVLRRAPRPEAAEPNRRRDSLDAPLRSVSCLGGAAGRSWQHGLRRSWTRPAPGA